MAKMFFARCKIKASFVFHSLMNIFEISNTPVLFAPKGCRGL